MLAANPAVSYFCISDGLFTFILSVFVSDPDIGMPTADAQRYFKELVSGVVSISYYCRYFVLMQFRML